MSGQNYRKASHENYRYFTADISVLPAACLFRSADKSERANANQPSRRAAAAASRHQQPGRDETEKARARFFAG